MKTLILFIYPLVIDGYLNIHCNISDNDCSKLEKNFSSGTPFNLFRLEGIKSQNTNGSCEENNGLKNMNIKNATLFLSRSYGSSTTLKANVSFINFDKEMQNVSLTKMWTENICGQAYLETSEKDILFQVNMTERFLSLAMFEDGNVEQHMEILVIIFGLLLIIFSIVFMCFIVLLC